MKRFQKLISSLLILTFLISAFSVFISASTDEAPEEEAVAQVIYNRDFDEGWDYTNGLLAHGTSSQNYKIDYEILSDYSYNYFLRIGDKTGAESYVGIDFSDSLVKEGATVIEMSLKADDVAEFGNIIYAHLAGATSAAGEKIEIVSAEEGNLTIFKGRWFHAPEGETECEGQAHNDRNGDGVCDKCQACRGVNLGAFDNTWKHFALIFDWDTTDLEITVLYDKDDDGNYVNTAKITQTYGGTSSKGMKYFRVGIPGGGSAGRSGMNYCVDNFKIYQGVKKITALEDDNYGLRVSPIAEKTIQILAGANVKTKAQLLEEALCLKVGVDYALFKNKRVPIYDGTYGAPSKIGENIMVPLELILDFIGYPYYPHPDGVSFDITTGASATYMVVGRDTATVDGERVPLTTAPAFVTVGESKYVVIAVQDIETLFPGWLLAYDDMGLIVMYEDVTPENTEDNEPIVTRKNDLSLMLSLMKKFVFQNVEAAEAEDAYAQTGAKIYNDVKTNTSFAHPYILANQATFDSLKATLSASEGDANYNKAFADYIQEMVDKANGYYAEYAKLEGSEYKGIKDDKVPVNVYSDGKEDVLDSSDGYSTIGGRLDMLVDYSEILPVLAFAYQVTGDTKYAKLAYDWSLALGNWDHWAPGYFRNCAETASNFAISYDWLYNAYVELYGKTETEILAKAIFDLGVHDGYVASKGLDCEHARVEGDESQYTTVANNKNVISSSGMIIAALSILDYASAEGNEAMLEEAKYLLGNNLINLANYGLDEYAPDGSYIESPVHWADATNAFVNLIASLNVAAGTDYGFVDTWGFNTTAYFAAHIESSDGFMWNYNDGPSNTSSAAESLKGLDTQSFFFLANTYGNAEIASLREKQIAKGKTVGLLDVLFYPVNGITVEKELTLTYYMDGIQAYVARSDWEDGAFYVGIMAGFNDCERGQIDSGNFVYYNKGIAWFIDLGTENPDVYQYYGANRYKYFKTNAEGQNVVFMTTGAGDVPYGQFDRAGGTITKMFENEHGSYAIVDNTAVYPGKVNDAYRGLLITNDKQTTVIQDQIAFMGTESCVWVAQTAQDIELDENNNRIAYLNCQGADGVNYTLRATLVTNTREIGFSILETAIDEDTKRAKEVHYLTGVTYEYGSNYGGAGEYDRLGLKRLVVRMDSKISFNISVVFEMVDRTNFDKAPGYEWTLMNEWVPLSAEETIGDPNERKAAVMSDIVTYTEIAAELLDDETAFSDDLSTFYKALAQVAYTLETYDADSLAEAADALAAYGDYLDLLDEFSEYQYYLNEKLAITHENAKLFVGLG